MGIKYLNQFLKENCSKQSIYKFHLRELKGKTVVIDTSIYLYKFLSENALLENFYLFLSILLQYGAEPIFIFDGKPPAEKKALLLQRLLEKREAETKYQSLASSLDSIEDPSEKLDSENKMRDLKKQFIRVQPEDIEKVKALMDAYGVAYYDAPGEADQICAFYMKTGKAWACFSDDMDMLVYEKTTNIIRNLSLMNHTAFLYKKPEILLDLEMKESDFNDIMILSGTDYNLHSNTCLKETIRWYYEYNKYRETIPEEEQDGFYNWLNKHTKYISDYLTLLNTAKMFHIEEPPAEIEIKKTKTIQMEKIKSILLEEGFLFL